MVEDGQRVKPGDQLYKGSLNPHELLKYRGALETARYIVSEVQEVYHKQGVQIDDKHVELICRQMTKKVLVETPGDTTFLPGRMVDRLIFDEENRRVEAMGNEPATSEEIILGITKASLATESFLSAAFLPGNHEGAHRCRPRRQDRRAARPQRERYQSAS